MVFKMHTYNTTGSRWHRTSSEPQPPPATHQVHTTPPRHHNVCSSPPSPCPCPCLHCPTATAMSSPFHKNCQGLFLGCVVCVQKGVCGDGGWRAAAVFGQRRGVWARGSRQQQAGVSIYADDCRLPAAAVTIADAASRSRRHR